MYGGSRAGCPAWPTWTPCGPRPARRVLFAHAAAAGPPSQTFGQPSIAAWYATRRLWVYPLGGNLRLVSRAGTAIADPTWSADGKLLLYVRDDGL
jgi:WD40 repeat protein